MTRNKKGNAAYGQNSKFMIHIYESEVYTEYSKLKTTKDLIH